MEKPKFQGFGVVFIPNAMFSPERGNTTFDGNTGSCIGDGIAGVSEEIGRLF
jgi:hypothetical protein